jgi:hypothetical protein
MQDACYLRSQAELCLQIARALSDHKAAENLRAVAAQCFLRTLEAKRRLGTLSRISFLLKNGELSWRVISFRPTTGGSA